MSEPFLRRSKVVLKNADEIERMYRANQHTAEILAILCEQVKPGISTWDLDQIARAEVAKRPIQSACLGYRGYPAMVCTSVNEEVVHGIPRRDKVLKEGDIIGIDLGMVCDGFVGDTARTVAVGKISQVAQQLVNVTETCLQRALAACGPTARISDIGQIIQPYAESFGYGVVRDFVGHGIGRKMHEEPQITHFYDGPKPRMRPGLVIAIEPMINLGSWEVRLCEDGWTAVTKDGKISAHCEHTVAITENGYRVLSQL